MLFEFIDKLSWRLSDAIAMITRDKLLIVAIVLASLLLAMMLMLGYGWAVAMVGAGTNAAVQA